MKLLNERNTFISKIRSSWKGPKKIGSIITNRCDQVFQCNGRGGDAEWINIWINGKNFYRHEMKYKLSLSHVDCCAHIYLSLSFKSLKPYIHILECLCTSCEIQKKKVIRENDYTKSCYLLLWFLILKWPGKGSITNIVWKQHHLGLYVVVL